MRGKKVMGKMFGVVSAFLIAGLLLSGLALAAPGNRWSGMGVSETASISADKSAIEGYVPAGEQTITFNISVEKFPIEGHALGQEPSGGNGCNFAWYGDEVWSEKPQYTPAENFIDYAQFANYSNTTSNYTIYFYLYNPSGILVGSINASEILPGWYSVKWVATPSPPAGGWELGDWQACWEVQPELCSPLANKCCINKVVLLPPAVPTLSRWGAIAMIIAVAGCILWTLRRRRVSSEV
jgi:hypothetical protein